MFVVCVLIVSNNFVILRDLSTIFLIVFYNDMFGDHAFIVIHTLSFI